MRRWLTAGAGDPRLQVVVGSLAIVAYLGLRVDPSVFYEHGVYFPAFQYGAEFLQPFLSRPGGASRYIAAYLAQACANRWLGAGAFTALALLLGWGYGLYVRYSLGKRALPWGALAVLATVLVWTRYGFHLDSITALALAVLGAAAYAHPRLGALPPRLRAGLALAWLAWAYWCGGGAAFVGVLLGSAVEHQHRRQPRLAALLLLSGLLLPVVLGHLLLALPLHQAVTGLLPYSDTSRLQGGLSLCLLYAVALLPAFMLFLKPNASEAGERAGRRSAGARRLGWRRLSPRWQTVITASAAVALVAAAWPPYTARRMAVMKHCRARQWQRVLTTAAKVPAEQFTIDVSYAVNLALYHTGRLGESMFAYPQGPLSLNLGTAFASCPNRYCYAERPKAAFDHGLANLEMGFANEAEHIAHEALEIYGRHPSILKQLVFANLVKGRVEAARTLLHALCQDPVARPWARAMLAALARGPEELLEGELVAGMRANLPSRQDRNAPLMTLEERCLGQLEENPGNRMAFEYLMAHYLITNNLDGFIQALPRAQTFGVASLPRHYQEAVLLYEAKTGGEVAPWSSQVHPEIRAQFRDFVAIVAPPGARPTPGQALAAAGAFRHTYFHHHVFRQVQ